MEFLLLIFAVLFLFYLHDKNKNNSRNQSQNIDSTTRKIIADKLEEFADRPEYSEERATYLAIVESIRTGRMPRVTAKNESTGEETEAEGKSVETQPREVVPEQPSNVPQQKTSQQLHVDQLLQNVNILLYLGAFLVVVSAAILVSANFDTFSGIAKFLIISTIATLFYGLGLYLFKRKPKLLPAGKTFVGIGLLLLPLSGLSFKVFLLPDANWELAVFLVSILALALYIFTYNATRQTYIYYLSLFMIISSVESGLINLGGYSYFGSWVALLIAVFFMLRFKRTQDDEERQALEVSANLLVPAAVFVQITEHMTGAIWPISLSMLFAAGYYLLASFISDKNKDVYSYLSLLLLPASAVTYVYDLFGQFDQSTYGAIALLLVIMSILYLLIRNIQRSDIWNRTLEDVSAILAVFAPLIAVLSPPIIVVTGLLSLTGQMVHAFMRRSLNNFVAALITVTALPILTFNWVFEFSGDRLWLALFISYLIQTVIPALSIYVLEVKDKGWKNALRVWFFISMTLMIFVASLYSLSVLSLALSIGAAFILLSSYKEKNPQFVLLAAGMVYFALYTGFRGWFDVSSGDALPFASFIAAPVFMAIGSLLQSQSRYSYNLRMSALAAGGAGLLAVNDAYANISLYLLSLVVGVEALIQRKSMFGFASGALFLAAGEWTMHQAGISELQFYTIPWSIYLAIFSYYWHRKGNREQRDTYAIAGLAILSVPLLYQTLTATTIGYFILLLVESIILMSVGVFMRYRLLLWWGGGVLAVATLYQVSEVIFALPKYLLTLGAGVILLGVATYYLQRNNNS